MNPDITTASGAKFERPAGEAGAPIDPELTVSRLARAAKLKQQHFQEQSSRRRRERFLLAGLAGIFCLAGLLLGLFPTAVALHLPGAARFYSGLGRDINLRGLTISDISPELTQTVDGKILALQGTIENISSTDRRIPPLRFALFAKDQEIFSWKLPASSRALKPGESTSFLTRIADPPKTAEKIEIRFARDGEIGSNAQP